MIKKRVSFDVMSIDARPFVKWVGGKGQLLNEIQKIYSAGLGTKWTKYAEPFVGGGAVLFNVLNKYYLKDVYISDLNYELIITYRIIRDSVEKLVKRLKQLQKEFIPLSTENRKIFYYEKRGQFNILKSNITQIYSSLDLDLVELASLFIFLNKTCFNGLYRVNQSGEHNVPMGSYKNPKICDSDNLFSVSSKLQDVQMVCGDYQQSRDFIDSETFVYFDPPYRPISETSSFASYTQDGFNDAQQQKLADFINEINDLDALIIASNSDPNNINSDDHFFERLYASYCIKHVDATRMINCNSSARGCIKELLVTNANRFF
ncbi:MAG: DNA adenine methylase [Planctomycetaceae bacterium]|jgi:DNA adenine methylase|nr:DNA adenine methylase [Planctomycetaceae bacterium]